MVSGNEAQAEPRGYEDGRANMGGVVYKLCFKFTCQYEAPIRNANHMGVTGLLDAVKNIDPLTVPCSLPCSVLRTFLLII